VLWYSLEYYPGVENGRVFFSRLSPPYIPTLVLEQSCQL